MASFAPPPLLERDHELRLLYAVAADVAAGDPRLVVVTGEAGVGKTRLCREFLAQLPDGWDRLVGSVEPPAELPDDGQLRVVLAEDLHHRDADAARRLGALVERSCAVLVIGTYRLGGASITSDVAREVAALIGRHDGLELQLAPLSETATNQLVDALGGTPQGADRASIHRRTAGNPLFVEEVVRAGVGVPWTVSATVLARIGPLTAPARTAIEALALAGRPLPHDVLARVHPGSASTLPALVDAALAVDEGAEVALRHPLVGEIVEGQLGHRARRDLHRRLAAAWVSAPAPPAGDVARHLAAAGASDEARPWVLQAADEALAIGAFGRATDWYRILLEQPDPDHVHDIDGARLEQAAVAAAHAGRTGTAERWARAAELAHRDAGDDHRAAALWLNPALTYIRRPPLDLTALDPDAAGRLAMEADVAARRGDVDTALDCAHRALEVAAFHGEHDAGGTASMAMLLAGDPRSAMRSLEGLRRSAITERDALGESRRSTELSRCALALGDVSGAITHSRTALSAAQRVPDSNERAFVLARLAATVAVAGDLAAAEDMGRELLAHGSETVRMVAAVPLALVDLARGEFGSAEERLALLVPYRDLVGPDLFAPVVLEQAVARLLAGDLHRAGTLLADVDAWAGGLFEPTRPDRLELGARLALLEGREDRLETLVTAATDLAAHPSAGPGLHAVAELVKGFAASVRDELVEAENHLVVAARQFRHAPRLFAAADAWCDAAVAAGRAGLHDRARHAIAEARVLADAHGYRPVIARIDAVEASLAADRPLSPEAARLTGRERSIIELVAAGRTNKAIAEELHLAEKTVRNQLSLLFAKLGIERRAQAAAFAVRHGLADDRG